MKMSIEEAIGLCQSKLQEFKETEEDNKVQYVDQVLEQLYALESIDVREIPYNIADNPIQLNAMYIAAMCDELTEFWEERSDE